MYATFSKSLQLVGSSLDVPVPLTSNKQADMEEAMSDVYALESYQLIRGTSIWAWFTVLPYTVNRTDMGDQECQNSLFLYYVIDPPDLPSH